MGADRNSAFTMPSPHWQFMAPELVDMVAQCLIGDISHLNLRALVRFIMVCRLFYIVGSPILYKAAALRHPYMLAWAAETNNMAVLRRLLDAGMDPDTVFWPPRRIERYRMSWKDRCCRTYGPKYWDMPVPHQDEKHQAGYIFWHFYMISDAELYYTMQEAQPKFTVFCTNAADLGGHPFLGFATLKGSHPLPVRRGSKPWVINKSSPNWRQLQKRGRNTLYISALHNAAAHGHVDAMRLLLERGATIDVAAPTLCNCNHLSFQKSGPPPFEMVPDSPEELTQYNQRRWLYRNGLGYLWTALHLAICQGQLASVRFLLSQGARYLSETRRHLPYQTALHQAAALSPAATGIVAHLLTLPEFSALLPTAGNAHGITPLWTAYLGGREDNMRLLVHHGASLDATVCSAGRRTPRSNTFTMLYHACASGRLDMARLLLRLGASATPEFMVPQVLLDTAVLGTDDHDGPFPMRALDILVAALSRGGRHGEDGATVRRAEDVVNALVTAGGDIPADWKVEAGEAPSQDPFLVATRGFNVPLLELLLRHPAFARYCIDEDDVYQAVKEGNAFVMRNRGADGGGHMWARGLGTAGQAWYRAIRQRKGEAWLG